MWNMHPCQDVKDDKHASYQDVNDSKHAFQPRCQRCWRGIFFGVTSAALSILSISPHFLFVLPQYGNLNTSYCKQTIMYVCINSVSIEDVTFLKIKIYYQANLTQNMWWPSYPTARRAFHPRLFVYFMCHSWTIILV